MVDWVELIVEAGRADSMQERSDAALGAMILSALAVMRKHYYKNNVHSSTLIRKLPNLLASDLDCKAVLWEVPQIGEGEQALGPWRVEQTSSLDQALKPLSFIISQIEDQRQPSIRNAEEVEEGNARLALKWKLTMENYPDLLALSPDQVGAAFRSTLETLNEKIDSYSAYMLCGLLLETGFSMKTMNVGQLNLSAQNATDGDIKLGDLEFSVLWIGHEPELDADEVDLVQVHSGMGKGLLRTLNRVIDRMKIREIRSQWTSDNKGVLQNNKIEYRGEVEDKENEIDTGNTPRI